MDNTVSLGKRVLAIATAAATIVWAVGIAAFAVPQTANAATAGDRIKGTSLTTVYYYGYDGSRYTFPNYKTYNTWYSDFSGVQTLSDSAIAAITLGGNIVYRPGARWIKIQSDPKTYAVGRDGKIQWIESETVATNYAGSNWNQSIDDVPDVFFVDYSTGASLMTAKAFDGMMYLDGTEYVLSWGGERRVVSAAGMTANNMRSSFFLDGANIDDSALTAGAQITSNICDLTDAAQTGCTAAVTGGLSVSLSSATPAGATLPKGANSVQVLTVDVTAGSAAATLKSLTLTMSGVGATGNVANAFLYEGSSRLTEARSVNASTRKVSFNNLNLAFNANQKRSLTLRIEVSTTAASGDQIQFSVASSSDVTAGGSVSGSYPVTGNTFTLANVSAGTLTVTKNGTIVDPTLGATDHLAGQFKITANNEDASVREITLKIDSADDHSNFKLWSGTTLLATGVNLGGKLVKFDLSSSPLVIAEGGNKIFKVTMNIGGDAGDTVKVYIDKAVDILALGGDYGFGMSADITTAGTYDGVGCAPGAGNCSCSTIKGGDVTFAFNGPSAGNIATNTQDQIIYKFSLTAKNEITVKDLNVIIYGDDDDNDPFDGTQAGFWDDDSGLYNGDNGNSVTAGDDKSLKDIKIVNLDTDAVLMGPLELAALGGHDAQQTMTFTDDFTVETGETLNLGVSVDVDNGVADGTEFGATLVLNVLGAGGFNAEDSNGDAVTAGVVPSTNLTGFAQTAKASSLRIQLASSPTSTTAVQGTSGIGFLGVVFTAGEASNISISSLTFSGYGDETNNLNMTQGGLAANYLVKDFVSSCSLYDGTTLVDGPKNVALNGDVVFDTMNWNVLAGKSQTLALKCNLANPSDTDLDAFAFDIEVGGDVTAEDVDNNTPTITLVGATGASDKGINDTTGAGDNSMQVAVTVDDVGTLVVNKGSSMPTAGFLVAGSTGNYVANYLFSATNEAFNVSTLTLSEEQAEDDTGVADSAAYANNINQVTIEYPKADGTTTTNSVSMTGNEAKNTGLSMYVAAGKSAAVKVSVSVPVSARTTGGSATSNEKVRMGFFLDAANNDNFRADGASSGSPVDDSGIAGPVGDDSFTTDGIPTFVVRETRPTVTMSSSSPVGSGYVPGDMAVFKFNVAANSNEDVVLDEVMFKMSSSNNAVGSTWNECTGGGADMAASDFDLYNLNTTGTSTPLDTADGDWTLLDNLAGACGAGDVLTYALLTLPTSQIIPAGTTYTYALYFDSTGASSYDNDSVQFSLPADPILGTYVNPGVTIVDGAIALTDATITTSNGAAFSTGDVVCFSGTADTTCDAGEEVALVTGIAGNDLTFARGYLGRDLVLPVNGDVLVRLPSSFVWQDDGNSIVTTSNEEFWGSYLVTDLPIAPSGAMGF